MDNHIHVETGFILLNGSSALHAAAQVALIDSDPDFSNFKWTSTYLFFQDRWEPRCNNGRSEYNVYAIRGLTSSVVFGASAAANEAIEAKHARRFVDALLEYFEQGTSGDADFDRLEHEILTLSAGQSVPRSPERLSEEGSRVVRLKALIRDWIVTTPS